MSTPYVNAYRRARRGSFWMSAALAPLLGTGAMTSGVELFDAPGEVSEAGEVTTVKPQAVAFRPLPPCECEPVQRRNALFPSSLQSSCETSLFFRPPITRPLIGPPLLYRPAECIPPAACPPNSPGFFRGVMRYGIVSPVPPATVSDHAPPWEQLPTPAELKGGVLSTAPTCADR